MPPTPQVRTKKTPFSLCTHARPHTHAGHVERFSTIWLAVKYYEWLATKSEIQTHPVRKNVAAARPPLFS